MSSILWLSEISQEDSKLIGNNCYDLSLLYKARLPVANGFCLKKQAFADYLAKTGIKYKVENLLSQANLESSDALKLLAEDIKAVILLSDINPELKHELQEAYSNMSIHSELHGLVSTGAMSLIKAGRESQYVALSTSFTNLELLTGIIHGVKGLDNLLAAIKKCW